MVMGNWGEVSLWRVGTNRWALASSQIKPVGRGPGSYHSDDQALHSYTLNIHYINI